MKRIAIVGATGAVGQEFERVLGERDLRGAEYRLLASARSAGQSLPWLGRSITVEELTPDSFAGIDLALFSAGGGISREYATHAVRAGAVVVDNSSAFRMDPDVPLVVPEVNPEALRGHQGIVANPNCSTIIMVVPLWPLHQKWGLTRVSVATYQAASGAGAQALRELDAQTQTVLDGGAPVPEVFPVACAFNVFSHNTAVDEETGFNVEETKMVLETRKIFGAQDLSITTTCMRVPVRRAHLEAIQVEFAEPVEPDAVREVLRGAPGVTVVDDRANNDFPTSLTASGIDDVLVGRIRRDPTVADGRGLQFICAGDQLRKGAALNAVQIAEALGAGA